MQHISPQPSSHYKKSFKVFPLTREQEKVILSVEFYSLVLEVLAREVRHLVEKGDAD